MTRRRYRGGPGNRCPPDVFVRPAQGADGEGIAPVFAAVVEEGSIGTQPPVDIEAYAARFREMLDGGPLVMAWVVEVDGRVVGSAGLHEGPGASALLACSRLRARCRPGWGSGRRR